MTAERPHDYELGDDSAEEQRLELQHRVWRDLVLDCWKRAGLGQRVLDIGAGPGFATLDLARIVGPGGEVVALERAANFVAATRETVRAHALTNVRVEQTDLLTDELPKGEFDFTWCRFVAVFVNEQRLVTGIAGALRPSGIAVFHEYGQYDTWRFSPRLAMPERFVESVVAKWGHARGRAGVGYDLPPLFAAHGFAIRWIEPRIFCLKPGDAMWPWPISFVASTAARLSEVDAMYRQFLDGLQRRLREVEANPDARMVTPLVLKIVAEKIR